MAGRVNFAESEPCIGGQVNHSPLSRLGVACLGIGGLCQAAAVLLAAGRLAGPDVMLSTSWIVAHNIQFVGAALQVFGVVSLYQLHGEALDGLGHVAFVMALLGCAFAFADADISAGLFPFIAAVDRRLVMPNGFLFHPPLPALRMGILMYGLGWLLFGIAISKAGVLPRWIGAAIALGAVLTAMSPAPLGPFPWILQAAGAVLMAVGMSNAALHGWMSATSLSVSSTASSSAETASAR